MISIEIVRRFKWYTITVNYDINFKVNGSKSVFPRG